MRAVQSLSRHARIDTLLKYDDRRKDGGGRMRRILGEDETFLPREAKGLTE